MRARRNDDSAPGGAEGSVETAADGDEGTAGTEADASAGGQGERRFSLRRLWPLGLVLGAMVALYFSGATQLLSLETIIRERETLAAAVEDNFALALALYLVVYVGAVALSLPGAAILSVVGGFLFGPYLGTVLTVAAATAGASIIFLIARTSLGEMLRARAGRFTERLAKGFEENAFSYLLLLRLVPLFPFWLINIAPALFDVKLRTYATATAIGIVPGTLAYCLLGSGLGDVIVALEEANPGCAEAGTCELELSALVTPGFLVAIGALSVAALIPIVIKKVRRRRAAA